MSWARIRRQKARELHVNNLGQGPLFSGLGSRIGDAWELLDDVFLWHMARLCGNEKEMQHFEGSAERLDKDLERIRGELTGLLSRVPETSR